MPRFIARPVEVEAHQYDGTTVCMPDDFRRALRRYLPDGTVEFMTGDGPRPCKYRDWVMRGPDGQISVIRDAAFEAMFAPVFAGPPPEALMPALPPALPIPAKGARKKDAVHA
jgi:hypothetical protein